MEQWITPEHSERIRSKLVVLEPGQSIGEHITENKEEVIVVLEGEATVNIESDIKRFGENSAVYIGKGKKHNITNSSDKPLKYVYVVALHE